MRLIQNAVDAYLQIAHNANMSGDIAHADAIARTDSPFELAADRVVSEQMDEAGAGQT
jgi:hypothetical protein